MLSRQRITSIGDDDDAPERIQQRSWLFTLNNYSEQDCQTILDYAHGEFKTQITKIVIGKEVAPTTGTPHLQGFVKFVGRKRLWNVRQLWQGKAHWEPARGTDLKNLQYCTKAQNVLTCLGFKDEQKVEMAKTHALQGAEYWQAVVKDAYIMGPEEFATKWPKEWLIRRGAVERLMLDASKQTMRVWNGNLQMKNIWIWGKPGIGKSKWAHRQETGGQTLFKNLNRWWDGMDVRAVTKVLIEDFPSPAYDGMAHLLKIWGDRYTFTGEVKNSAIAIDPGRFFLLITSNFHPRGCFSKSEDLEAISRRFAVIEMTEENRDWVKRIRLDPSILSKQEQESEEEEDGGEEEAITMEQALLSLKVEPGSTANELSNNWGEGEVHKYDSQGRWTWVPGRGFVKDEEPKDE
jgi:hypothetical protein